MKRFPEMILLRRLASTASRLARVREENTVHHKGLSFPLYSFTFGSTEPTAPTLVFTGGVHGLERIGTRVVTSYLKTFVELAKWDTLTQSALQTARVVFYPLVNPAGMYFRTRSNPNGVDIMRNAPIEAEDLPRFKMLAGHRISRRLPWFRGTGELELETLTLLNLIKREAWQAKRAITLDVHSGYGSKDRLWFPYAKSKKPIPHLGEMVALKKLLDRVYPNHIYCIEPQALQYTTHGDVWDFLYEVHRQEVSGATYLPLCLEMGSWMWVKKNPKQLLSVLGAFNPIMPHRLQRTLRRHVYLFDFLLRACLTDHWGQLKPQDKTDLENEGKALWFHAAS